MYTRVRRDIEPRWVSEYVVAKFPRAPVKFRCPLGPIPRELTEIYGKEKAIRVYRPYRPEVDALVMARDRLVLIEAKIFKYMDGLSKLPVYKALIPDAPELRPWVGWRVDMQLLVPRRLDWVVAAGKRMGVEILDWAPDWVLKIWEERDKYWTREAVAKREARKAVLRRLGYV